MIIVFVRLSKGNSRNTVLRAEVKSHKVLKEVKVFAFECSVRNLKNFSKFAGKNPYWNLFIVKFQPGIAYKKNTIKVTRSTSSKKRRRYKDSYTSTFL